MKLPECSPQSLAEVWQSMVALAVCSMISGCTVGPDFKAPPPPVVRDYTAKRDAWDSAAAARVASQYLLSGQDIPGQWWTLFHSRDLDTLIRQALRDNPDLQSAQAALHIAMENVKAQAGHAYPAVNASVGISRNKDSAELSPVLASPMLLYDLYQTQMSVSWSPDIWGGNRRQVEALKAQADGQTFQLRAVRLALVANIVAGAIQEASLRDQIAAVNEIIADEQAILQIERRQSSLGQIAGADVVTQETLLAQAEAAMPPLQKQLAQQRDLLTALAGRLPDAEIEQTFILSSLTLPKDLPLSLPSALTAHRPDIRMAEENLHAASAEIGVTIANMLPNIVLSANDGSVATQLGQLVAPGDGFWSLGAGVAQPIFDAGTLLHRTRAARAVYEQAGAQYRSVVIAAFENVADVLQSIRIDEGAYRAAEQAESASAHALAIARKQLSSGQVSRLAVLDAEQAHQLTRLVLVQATAARFVDSAALFQALGGGWWNQVDTTSQNGEAQDERF